MKKYYVYVWYIEETGEVFYVGKGSKDRCKSPKGRNKFFTNIYETHSCNYFLAFDKLTEKEAFQKEVETIAYYRENYPQFRLTNQTDGGEGVSGWIAPQEYREYFRIKNTGESNPNYGNFWTEEQKRNLSNQRKGMYSRERNPRAKRVMCIETGEIFLCILDAAEKYSIKSSSSVSMALNKKNKTAASLHWVEIKEDEIPMGDSERQTYFLECLLSDKETVFFISLQSLNILNKMKLKKLCGVALKTIDKQMRLHNQFTHNDETFIYLSDYYSRLIQ